MAILNNQVVSYFFIIFIERYKKFIAFHTKSTKKKKAQIFRMEKDLLNLIGTIHKVQFNG